MSLLRKIEKTKRYWSWRLKPAENQPLFWHVGRPNFGDDINPSFLECLTGQPIRFAADRSQPHLLGVGSILESATPSSIVIGSGYLKPESGPLPKGATVISLRGQRSLELAGLELAGCDDRILLGDPLVLVDTLFDKSPEKKYRTGLVAHVLNIGAMKAKYGRHTHLISPMQEPWKVVEEIASCEQIVSQSLHGLIVADAFDVPSVWIAPSDSMTGGRFKFDDYYSTLDQAKPPLEVTEDLFCSPSKYPFLVSRFKYSKTDYREALTQAFARLTSTNPHKEAQVSL